jgi:hypothetical protein
MSLWETSHDPQLADSKTLDVDKQFADNRQADGTTNGITNKGPAPKPFAAARDGRFYGSDGSRQLFFIGYQKGGFPAGDVGMKVARPGGDAFNDPLNQLLFYWDFSTGTQYFNDPVTGINYEQNGILPDGSGGFALARNGFNVADVYVNT